MHTIQEMAQMCGTTAKTLRFYDKMGIFCPDYTDPENGYRYYTDRQVPKYQLIEEYKRMGFTLSEIRRLISHSAEADVPEILRWKIAELQEAIAACNERLEKYEQYERAKQCTAQAQEEKPVVERDNAGNRVIIRFGDVTRSIIADPDETELCYNAVTGLFTFSHLSADDIPKPEYRVVFTRHAEANGKKMTPEPLYPSAEESGKAEIVLIVIQAGPLVDIAACNEICNKLCGHFSDAPTIHYTINYYGAEEETVHINMIGLCAV